MPFRERYPEETIATIATRRREGASLRALQDEFGIPMSTLSRRLAAYEKKLASQLAVRRAAKAAAQSNPETRSDIGGRPEDSDTRAAPPPAVAEAQAQARYATRPSRDRQPPTKVWKDAERFAPWETGFALVFDQADAAAILTHQSPEFAGSTRRFSIDTAEQALVILKQRGYLYSPEPDRIATRVPLEANASGRDRQVVIPGIRNSSEAGRLAYREWVRVRHPGRGGSYADWLSEREAERAATAAIPEMPRVEIHVDGQVRARTRLDNADRVAAALNLPEGSYEIVGERTAAVSSS
jgi:hypothetical protein